MKAKLFLLLAGAVSARLILWPYLKTCSTQLPRRNNESAPTNCNSLFTSSSKRLGGFMLRLLGGATISLVGKHHYLDDCLPARKLRWMAFHEEMQRNRRKRNNAKTKKSDSEKGILY